MVNTTSSCAALLCAITALSSATLRAQDDDFYALELQSGASSLLKGRLDRAAYHFDEVLAGAEEEVGADRPSPAQEAAARTGLWEIDLRRGRYEVVLEGFAARPQQEQERRANQLLRVRALEAVGRYGDATLILEQLAAANESGDFESSHRLGQLQRFVGRRDDARATWQKVVAAAAAQLADNPTAVDPVALGWAGRAAVALGDPQDLQQAAKWFVQSVRGAPDDPHARTAYGELMFEVYGEAAGFPSGEKSLNEVLERNGDVEEALLALYRLRRSNSALDYSKTDGYLERVLGLNPRSVPALIYRAELTLWDRRFDDGAALLDEILKINPRHKRALALRAAAALLLNNSEDHRRFRERALEVDSTYREVDMELGDLMVRLYRFADAVPVYRRVLEQEPESVATLHGLAKALIYVGKGNEALELLKAAKELEPGYVSPWRNNAMAAQELLEEEYVTVSRGGIDLRLHAQDAAVLEQYLMPLYLEAMAVLGEKYGYVPTEPITVEVLRTWDDFSVRTTGFRGFTALGACFGPLITLVSPRDGDLRRQDFMWAATVWHEYAHVLTLALSNSRVPRWLTEGCSVHEEGQKNPLWERGMQRELYDAWFNDDIPPVALLNRLFRGSRILFGYFQGGMIVDLVHDEWGFDKVREMLAAYGRDLSTEQVFRTVLGIPSREFDQKLMARVRERLAPLKLVPNIGRGKLLTMLESLAKNGDDLDTRVLIGWAYLQRGNPVDAGRELARVLDVAPDNGAAHLLHAALLLQRGDTEQAKAKFELGFAAGVEDFDSRLRYARLLEGEGRLDDAIAQYQRAKLCWPNCTDQGDAPALQLARVYAQQGDEDRELMELKTFIRRTARAFRPRLRLAAAEADNQQWNAAARLLEEAVQIDPFMRELHERLATCYEELGQPARAAAELEVAAAVAPSLDREYLGSREVPQDGGPEDVADQRALYERASELWSVAGEVEKAQRAAEAAGK